MRYNLTEILNNVEQIRQAIYGEEVRGSISNSIEMMAYETDTIGQFKESVTVQLKYFQETYEKDFLGFKDEVSSELADFKSTYESDFNKHKLEVQDNFDKFASTINDQFTEYRESMNTTYTEFTKDVELKLTNYNTQNETFKKELTARVDKLEEDITNQMKDFTTRITKQMNEFTSSVTVKLTDFGNRIDQHEETVSKTLEQYLADLNSIKKDIESMLENASQANPNIELTDAREGEATLKANLNKNYTKKSELEPLQTSISELKDTTTALGGRTDKLEQYVTKHSNPVLTINKEEPDEAGNIDITAGTEVIDITYSELSKLIAESKLATGGTYILTDYQTKYIQPLTGLLKEMPIEKLILTASSDSSIQPIVYSFKYPEDIIWYDVSNSLCEDKRTPRPGFITRRYDTVLENNCPQDWRTMLWGRWKPDENIYYKDGERTTYSTWTSGNAQMGVIYKFGNKLLIAKNTNTPTSADDENVFQVVYEDITIGTLVKDKTLVSNSTDKLLELKQGELHERLTFGEGCKLNYIGDVDILHGNVFGDGFIANTLGDRCRYNTFGDGCISNTFGDYCYNNTFGNNCSNNIFGNDCYVCNFRNDCSYNQFGNDCHNNSFGVSCLYNKFGHLCYNNQLQQDCKYNNFKNGCVANNFADKCLGNVFNNLCSHNTFSSQCSNNIMLTSCLDNTFKENISNIFIKRLSNKILTGFSHMQAGTIDINSGNRYVFMYLDANNNPVYEVIP